MKKGNDSPNTLKESDITLLTNNENQEHKSEYDSNNNQSPNFKQYKETDLITNSCTNTNANPKDQAKYYSNSSKDNSNSIPSSNSEIDMKKSIE